MEEENSYNNVKDWSNIIYFSNGNVDVLPIKANPIISLKKAFLGFTKDILIEQKKIKKSDGSEGKTYYDSFKNTTNGKIIINPIFNILNEKLSIDAEVGFYESYHAFNGLKNGFGDEQIDFKNTINYKVLSAGVVMYDKKTTSFYLFKRPKQSQEAAGTIDLLGGCLNTKDGVLDGKVYPELFVSSRMKHKAGLDIDSTKLKCLGVQEFKKRGFYNIVYLYELNSDEIKVLQERGNISQIKNDSLNDDKEQDNPGGAALTLALKYLEKDK